MSAQSPDSWQQLFTGGNPAAPRADLTVRIIHRRGEPLLVLPVDSRLARAGLSLYPAQTPAARLAKLLVSLSLKLRLSVPGKIITLSVAPDGPAVDFLAQAASTHSLPNFALLAGNPNAPGRRFVLLLFNEQGKPAVVVKAGLGKSAMRLIEQELSFLSAVPPGSPGIPRPRSALRVEGLHAFALDFLAGHSPRADESAGLESLLARWIDVTRLVRIEEFPAWQRLAASGATDPATAIPQLRTAQCHPVIYHGDFAPWNIKVAGNSWEVLDWERGELTGIPGWDWFHYTIQSAVLIKREPPGTLVARVERLLGSAPFQRYAAQAAIVGIERPLLLAYLNYSIKILKQTEGLPRIQSLLAQLTGKWSDQ